MQLGDIRGLGENGIQRLNKAGIETPFDLACFFPSRYIDATRINQFDSFKNGDVVVVQGQLTLAQLKQAKNYKLLQAEFVCGGIKCSAVFFNQPFLLKTLKKGQNYCLYGRLKIFKGCHEIIAPKIVAPNRVRPIIPVYKSIGIAAARLDGIIADLLKRLKISGSISSSVRKKYGLMDVGEAFACMHFPPSFKQLDEARRTLSIENIAGYIKRFQEVKRLDANTQKSFFYGDSDILQRLGESLEYQLTDDQRAAIARITQLMRGKSPMNVMLQGDVGSGKTIVCFFAAAYAAASGHQTAFMAPTELLARQHFLSAQKLFKPLGIGVQLLTGSVKGKERQAALQSIESKSAMLIIGTHSLFQEKVVFGRLSLVITDEQHRFGVGQRSALGNKSIKTPDCIVVSATPIPRTLSLVLYGDLEPIIIRQKPSQRVDIKTFFVDSKVEQLYNYIFEKAKKDEQAFIVCPRVHEATSDEVADIESADEPDEWVAEEESPQKNQLISAEGLFKALKQQPIGEYIGLLHGQMKDEQKAKIMADFACGKIKVLVTTTVIEVGIDVPKATTIVIHNAERYGLSQLHQLRGRVGRGKLESFCFLFATPESYEKRLKFFQTCTDGFLLAEKDLENRGAGDFLGTSQHGLRLTFSGQQVSADLLLTAKKIAQHIVMTKPLTRSQTLFFEGLALN